MENKFTDINIALQNNEITNEIAEYNPRQIVLDMNIDINTRIKAFEEYNNTNPEDSMELIRQLSGMYLFSGSTIIEKFLYRICSHGNVSSLTKLEASKTLLSYDNNILDSEDEDTEFGQEILKINQKRKQIAYETIDYICYVCDDLPIPCRIEAILLLMEISKYEDKTINYLSEIINNQKYNCDFRYKTILNLEKRDISKNIIKQVLLRFIKEKNNEIFYRICAGQYLLKQIELEETNELLVSNILLSIANDENVEYNLRADASDVLLKSNFDNIANQAKELILKLGKIEGEIKNIYNNAQNVHSDEIEESTLEIMEFLAMYSPPKLNNIDITFEYVQNEIIKLMNEELDNEDDKEKINISLNRIRIDRALYTKLHQTILGIITKLWVYIINHENKEEIKIRLLEELIDMSGTCSSGFASRLANVISGFGDYNIRISWEDQIVSNFSGRLSARIKNIHTQEKYYKDYFEIMKLYLIGRNLYKLSNENKEYIEEDFTNRSEFTNNDFKINIEESIKNTEERGKKLIEKYLSENNKDKVLKEAILEYQDLVLYEMTLPSSNFHDRQNFLSFLRNNLPSLWNELWDEFKDYVVDTCFDLSMRKAIMKYEGENI
jgi:hypothetical protein